MNTYFIFLLMLLGINHAWGQQVESDEWALDDSTYNQLEELTLFGSGSKGAPGQSVVSLRDLCPPPGQMGNAPASVSLGWAIGYGAMTILYAKRDHWSARQIQEEAFSPYFLFDMLDKQDPKHCRLRRNYMQQFTDLLVQTGNVKNRDYHTSGPCAGKPDPTTVRRLKTYTIQTLARLFPIETADRGNSVSVKYFAIKRCIDAGRPAVIVLMTEEHFRTLYSDTWEPGTSSALVPQALVVVGYDDTRQAIEVMHAQGKNWGKNGFAYIRYQDLTFVKQGYQLLLNANLPTLATRKVPVTTPEVPTKVMPHSPQVRKPQKPVVATSASQSTGQKPTVTPPVLPVPAIPADQVALNGQFDLRIPIFNNPDQPQQYAFETVSIRRRGNLYETNGPWQLNQQFQLVSHNARANSYVYCFSLDPEGVVRMHFPRNSAMENLGMGTGPISPLMPDSTSEVIVPAPIINTDDTGKPRRQERALVKDVSGTDYIVVLYADRRIDAELMPLLSRLKRTGADIHTQLTTLFGDKLVPASHIRYLPDRMGFVSRNSSGYIVPLILKIDAL